MLPAWIFEAPSPPLTVGGTGRFFRVVHAPEAREEAVDLGEVNVGEKRSGSEGRRIDFKLWSVEVIGNTSGPVKSSSELNGVGCVVGDSGTVLFKDIVRIIETSDG